MSPSSRPRLEDSQHIEELRQLYSSRWLSTHSLHQLELQSGKKYKRGKFSLDEKRIVQQAVRDFFQERNVSPEEFVEEYFNKKHSSQNDLFATIAAKLNGRPVINVYHFVRRLYHPGNYQGQWSLEEDSELRRLHVLHSSEWEKIGKELGRSGCACRDRFRMIKRSYSLGRWSDDEEERLVLAVGSIRSGKGDPNRLDVWQQISDLVGTRSPSQCILKWHECICFRNLRSSKGKQVRWTLNDDYELIRKIYDFGFEHESEIIWKRLVQDRLSSWTPIRLQARWKQLRKRVANEKKASLEEVLSSLLSSIKPLSSDHVESGDDDDYDYDM